VLFRDAVNPALLHWDARARDMTAGALGVLALNAVVGWFVYQASAMGAREDAARDKDE